MILATVQEIAATLRVPPSTIRRWATEDQWVRYGTSYRRFYDLEDATRSYEQRRMAG